uniref:Kelch repeat-containing protein n=1 Tax=Cephaloticoccus sp. TaxID=1985742 RepID=UPI00404B8132
MRRFIRQFALASVLVTPGWAGESLATLDPAQPVAERIATIEQFLDQHYFDAQGLMYSHINWREERPFTADDFTPKDSTMPGPEPWQWMSYENSSFISGILLAAQCYRYEATQDPAALALATKAFHSLDVNYALTEQRNRAAEGPDQKAGFIGQGGGVANPAGFFCKPYYGQATDATSTEQHFAPMIGLYRYWHIADEPTRARIAQMFSEVSRLWRAGYLINYFGEPWDMEQSYPRAQRHMFLWMVMHRLAYEVTRDPESLAEFNRLHAHYANLPTPRETEWGMGHPSYVSTEDRSFHVQMVIGADLLLELELADTPRWLNGMEAWWRYSQIGQRDDLASYYFIRINALTGQWDKLPLSIKPRALWKSPFMLHNAILPICWLGTQERQTISSAIIARRIPAAAIEARKRYDRIYAGLDKDHLKWFVDPEGVMPDPLKWMLNVMQGDALAFYDLGYWYARAHHDSSMNTPQGWTNLTPLPDPIGFGGMFAGVLHDRLVSGGGSQWDKPVWIAGAKKSYSDAIWALSSPSGEWEKLAINLPTPRGHFSGAAIPGAVLLAGGIDDGGCLRSVLALRETADGLTWQTLPDLPEPVVYGCAAVVSGRFYVIGGLDDAASKTPSAAVWSLSIENPDQPGEWRREPDLPGPGVFVAAATGVKDQLYVFGGMAVDAAGNFEPSVRAYHYDPATRSWDRIADLPDPRVGLMTPCPVLPDNRILIAGGYSKMFPGVQREHPGFNDSTYYYDPASNAYTRGPDIPRGPVPDRDLAGDPGPAPMIGAPAVVWRNQAVAVSGEVRIATRSPQVLALPLPTKVSTESK